MTERYRRMADELRAKEEYDEERDRVSRPRPEPAQPAQIPAPWEGISQVAQSLGINLGELWKTREQEITQARQSADERERELHELRLREIDRRVEDLQKLAAATSTNLEGGNNQGGYRNRMEEAVNNLIADRIGKILGGNDQHLTTEDIKQIAVKAVQEGGQQRQSPQEVVESLMGFIAAAETAKKRMVEMGGGQPNGNPYLNQAGNMRGDVLKILLENDRETLKLKNDYEIQKVRNQHLGGLAGAFKDNFEDLVGASRDMVQEHRESGKQPPQNQSEEGGYQIKCSLCNEVSTFQEKPGPVFDCPKCGGKLKLQEPPQTHERKPLSTGLEI